MRSVLTYPPTSHDKVKLARDFAVHSEWPCRVPILAGNRPNIGPNPRDAFPRPTALGGDYGTRTLDVQREGIVAAPCRHNPGANLCRALQQDLRFIVYSTRLVDSRTPNTRFSLRLRTRAPPASALSLLRNGARCLDQSPQSPDPPASTPL